LLFNFFNDSFLGYHNFVLNKGTDE